jgi:GT2 family glycosyltransferase
VKAEVDFSVIVVSYRPGDWLAPCLESVLSQADDVVLVDNGSPGAAASRIARAAGARVLRVPVNTGFAPAVNLGARASEGEFLALLNDDAVASPGWLPSAAQDLNDPSVAAVGPKLVLAARYREIRLPDDDWYAPGDVRPLGRQIRSVLVNGTESLELAGGPGLYRVEHGDAGDQWRWTAGRRPWYVPLPEVTDGAEILGAELLGAEILIDGQPAPPGPVLRLVNSAGTFLDKRGYGGDIGANTPDDGRFDKTAERFGVSGNGFVTRMETWRQIGPFADRFFAYYEDIDWCWRAQLAGKRIVYDPSATVEHVRSASSGGPHRAWVRVMAERNRTLAMVRNGPLPLVATAVRDRLFNGPDGGVRAGIARLLPWALASRARLARQWTASPEEVWERWSGRLAEGPEVPASAISPDGGEAPGS